MAVINFVALILIVVGAINWGLWGFFQFDFIAWLFGGNASVLSRIVYSCVGLAGLWSLKFFGRCKAICCKKCHSCKDDECGTCHKCKSCNGCNCSKDPKDSQ